MIKCFMEKGHRSGESILKIYMLYPERFIGVDRKSIADLKQTKCEPKELSMQIPDQQISDEQNYNVTSAGDGPNATEEKETGEDDDAGCTRLEQTVSAHFVETVEDGETVSAHLVEIVEEEETSSTYAEETVGNEETVENEETVSTHVVEAAENSSSSQSSDSTSSDTSNLIGFSSGISVRLKDFSSGPTTPRARVRKSRRKLKRMRRMTSPIYRQRGQIYESSRRLQNISRVYCPQRNTNQITADVKALQKRLVNERVVGDANCRSRNMNICEVCSPLKRKISRVRAAEPLKRRSKSLWTSRTTPDREKVLPGQPYALLSKKIAQQTTNRKSKSRGRTKNLGSPKGVSVLKDKSIAEVYSSAPPRRTVVRHKR